MMINPMMPQQQPFDFVKNIQQLQPTPQFPQTVQHEVVVQMPGAIKQETTAVTPKNAKETVAVAPTAVNSKKELSKDATSPKEQKQKSFKIPKKKKKEAVPVAVQEGKMKDSSQFEVFEKQIQQLLEPSGGISKPENVVQIIKAMSGQKLTKEKTLLLNAIELTTKQLILKKFVKLLKDWNY